MVSLRLKEAKSQIQVQLGYQKTPEGGSSSSSVSASKGGNMTQIFTHNSSANKNFLLFVHDCRSIPLSVRPICSRKYWKLPESSCSSSTASSKYLILAALGIHAACRLAQVPPHPAGPAADIYPAL